MKKTIGISWTISEKNLQKLDSIPSKLNRSQKLNRLLDYLLTQSDETIEEFFKIE